MPMKYGALLIPSVLGLSAQAQAASTWPSQLTCGAGIHAYFLEDSPPQFVSAANGWFTFRSPDGNLHECQINSGAIALRWRNSKGITQNDISTQVTSQGDDLLIAFHGEEPWKFHRTGNTYTVLREGGVLAEPLFPQKR